MQHFNYKEFKKFDFLSLPNLFQRYHNFKHLGGKKSNPLHSQKEKTGFSLKKLILYCDKINGKII